MRKADLAYTAGIIDGEGCIGLTHRNNGYDNCYRYYLQITNSSLELLEWILDRLGGRIRLMHHSTYALEWQNKGDISTVLEMIKDFMIVKREEAEAMIDFCHTPSQNTEDRAMQMILITSSKKTSRRRE